MVIRDVDLNEPRKYPKERRDLVCGECGAPMILRYSHKYSGPFYGCTTFPTCRGTHGAHADGAPKGIPENRETKQARIKAHRFVDLHFDAIENEYDHT
jgi:ssDNA-binding Zn-finger/Zn-ribbon topoisomerase 1